MVVYSDAKDYQRKHETSGSVKSKEKGKNKNKNKSKNKHKFKKNFTKQEALADDQSIHHPEEEKLDIVSARLAALDEDRTQLRAQCELKPSPFTSDPRTSSRRPSNPYLKPKQTSTDLDNLSIAYDKVDGLWKDDGTVVIIAQNHIFRVYRGILIDHSGFFKQCFSSAPPLSGSQSQVHRGEVYNGVPVLRLDSNWEDLGNFLRVLMDRV